MAARPPNRWRLSDPPPSSGAQTNATGSKEEELALKLLPAAFEWLNRPLAPHTHRASSAAARLTVTKLVSQESPQEGEHVALASLCAALLLRCSLPLRTLETGLVDLAALSGRYGFTPRDWLNKTNALLFFAVGCRLWAGSTRFQGTSRN